MDTNVGRMCIAVPHYGSQRISYRGDWAIVNAEIGTTARSQRLKGKSSIPIPKTGFIQPMKILFGKYALFLKPGDCAAIICIAVHLQFGQRGSSTHKTELKAGSQSP